MKLISVLASAVVVILFVSLPMTVNAQQGGGRIIGFEPDHPAASKVQSVAVVPDPAQTSQAIGRDPAPPSNAQIIVSILALVISTVVMYFWARRLRKSKSRPLTNAGQGAAEPVKAAPGEWRRRSVLRIAMIMASLVTVFPPFYFQGSSGARFGLGHSFFLLPPRIRDGSESLGSIDAPALLSLLAGIALVAWLAIMISREWNLRR